MISFFRDRPLKRASFEPLVGARPGIAVLRRPCDTRCSRPDGTYSMSTIRCSSAYSPGSVVTHTIERGLRGKQLGKRLSGLHKETPSGDRYRPVVAFITTIAGQNAFIQGDRCVISDPFMVRSQLDLSCRPRRILCLCGGTFETGSPMRFARKTGLSSSSK